MRRCVLGTLYEDRGPAVRTSVSRIGGRARLRSRTSMRAHANQQAKREEIIMIVVRPWRAEGGRVRCEKV